MKNNLKSWLSLAVLASALAACELRESTQEITDPTRLTQLVKPDSEVAKHTLDRVGYHLASSEKSGRYQESLEEITKYLQDRFNSGILNYVPGSHLTVTYQRADEVEEFLTFLYALPTQEKGLSEAVLLGVVEGQIIEGDRVKLTVQAAPKRSTLLAKQVLTLDFYETQEPIVSVRGRVRLSKSLQIEGGQVILKRSQRPSPNEPLPNQYRQVSVKIEKNRLFR